VYKDVQTAPCPAHLIEQAIQVLEITDIRLDQNRSSAHSLNVLERGLGRAAISEEVYRYIGTRLGEAQGNTATDAAA